MALITCRYIPRTNKLMGICRDIALESKHKVFISHSGRQKAFAESLCVELERSYRFPFFDPYQSGSLPMGVSFPRLIFQAIKQCYVGVVILSDEFCTAKWPMMELVAMYDRVLDEATNGKSFFKIMPIFLRTSKKEFADPKNWSRWLSRWHDLAMVNPKSVNVKKWEAALKYLQSVNGLVYDGGSEFRFQQVIVDEICRVVPAEISFDVSHFQGRSRICNVSTWMPCLFVIL